MADDLPTTDLQTALERTHAALDAILRGNHTGWDQALSAARERCRNALDGAEAFAIDSRKAHGRILTGRLAHWCPDWDNLPVDESTPEIDGCTCYSAEEIDRARRQA
jgi:hypothetical protein